MAWLKQAFLLCDEDFLATLDHNVTLDEAKGWWNAGSCAVLAVIRGTTLFIAHVGDCRAVLVSSGQPVLPSSSSSSNGSANVEADGWGSTDGSPAAGNVSEEP